MERNSRSAAEEAEDLLSNLPSDVLVAILEKLDLRDAVRAGVLSSRWRCLPKRLPRLSLDINDFLPGDDEDGIDDHDKGEDEEDDVAPPPVADGDGDGYRDVLSEAGDRMVGVATALLASRPAAGNNDADDDSVVRATLAMSFHLRRCSCYMALGRLLDDAVGSGKVRAVELTITSRTHMQGSLDRESTERALLLAYGRRFRILFDAYPAAFGALTQLSLKKVKLGKPEFRDILDRCTRLEKLTLFFCVPGPGGVWRVRHARLTDVNISLCGIHGVNLEWLPKLERFAFEGWFSTTEQLLSFGHVPCLTTVTLSHDHHAHAEHTLKLSRIMANTTVKDLRLNFRGGNIWVQPETSRRLIDAFHNLKNLKIRNIHQDCGLCWTMFLLQSAPHLEELYIKLMDHECGVAKKDNVPWEVATDFKHYTLARITILGIYSTDETIVTYLRHLVKAAVNLEEIYMREKSTICRVCGPMEPQARSRFPRTDEDKDTFRKRITDGRSATFEIYIQS